MNIITISREFGSGGREVGKRLADALGYGYYDREILTAMAQSTEMEESYLEQILERGAATPQYPLILGRTLSQVSYVSNLSTTLLAKQTELIKKISQKGNCVIIGRNAKDSPPWFLQRGSPGSWLSPAGAWHGWQSR